MTGRPVRRSAASWAVDGSVMLLGAVIGGCVLVALARAGGPPPGWLVAGLVAVPVVGLMSRFPLVLRRGSVGIEVGFESAVLICLVVLGDLRTALAIWAVAQIASELFHRTRADLRAFNVAITIICGTAAATAMHAIGGLGRTSLHEALAVGTGCVVFFTLDYLISAVSVAAEERSPLRTHLSRQSLGLAGLVFVGVVSLGYLAVLVVRTLPAWADVLLVVPWITILVASRALSRGSEHQRRLADLLDGARAIHSADSRDAVLQLMPRWADTVLARPLAEVRTEPPAAQEIGASFGPSGRAGWLVAPRGRSPQSDQLDQQALTALAGIGDQTLDRLQLAQELALGARRDSLTGLPNRLLFIERLQLAIATASERSRVAVLSLDLDGFTSVNDRFGHDAGDDLLLVVGERLSMLSGQPGCVARLGGDEFALLVTDVGTEDEIERLCRRVLSAVRRDVRVVGHGVAVGASIGVALCASQEDPGHLLRNAEMAMYRAKTLGKDQHVVYHGSLRAERLRRLELVEALRAGVRHELVVHYQPVVALDTLRVTGVEALVRWQRGATLVPPDLFIAAAEDSGLIGLLGERVLHQVSADCARLVDAAGGPIDLAVNMSAHQLLDPGLPDQVQAAVQACQDSRLVLEMTETVLVHDDPHTSATLGRLAELGAKLAIDDFGVGFSSIGYLQHLPVDILKIDRSFIRDIDTLPRSRALVDAIVAMAGALDLDVIAEGIERSSQASALRQAGCPHAQGYLYGRPQPLAGAVRTVRRRVLDGKERATVSR